MNLDLPFTQVSHHRVVRRKWVRRISPEYSEGVRSYGSSKHSECLWNISRIFGDILEVRGYSGGSGMFTRFGYSPLQNHLEVSWNEVRKAIPPNIPNDPSNIRRGSSNISRIFGDIRLNGSPNLQNIRIIFGIFGRIPLPRNMIPIVGHPGKIPSSFGRLVSTSFPLIMIAVLVISFDNDSCISHLINANIFLTSVLLFEKVTLLFMFIFLGHLVNTQLNTQQKKSKEKTPCMYTWQDCLSIVIFVSVC